MHIAVDCRSVHRHMGGIGRAALELVRSLARADHSHQLSMIVGRDPGAELPTERLSIVPVEAAMIDERFEQVQLPSLLEGLHVDFYLNTTFSVPAIKTTKWQSSIIHDVVFEDRPDYVEPQLRSYLSRWSRFAAKEADHILTVSDHARARICQVYGVQGSRVTRVYNGIPASSYFPPDPREVERVRTKFQLADPFVLYLGSIESKKGIRELLSAFEVLRRSGFSGQLVLAGAPGGDLKDLETVIQQRGLAGCIRLLGYVDESDKKPLLKACRCFVYPSQYEGFGIPPLEAMALGIPCVVSDQTSLPEIVGDAALIAPLKDPAEFAGALAKALNDQTYRRAAGVAGPERARSFSWEDAASQVLSICEKVGEN